MTSYRNNNLKIESPGLGQILIQPTSYSELEVKRTDILLIPLPLTRVELEATEECLANSQMPAFCPKSELPRLDARGFGSYRFHRIETFEEINFSGGSIAFYPAKLPERGFVRGVLSFIKKLFTSKYDHQAFHLVISGYQEESVLFLSTPLVDAVEWNLLNRSKPTLIIGSQHYRSGEWKALAQKFNVEIVFQEEISVFKTKKLWTDKVNSNSEPTQQVASKDLNPGAF